MGSFVDVSETEIIRIRRKREYILKVSEPFVKAAEMIINMAPVTYFVRKDTGEMKRIYPYSVLRALVNIRTFWRLAIMDEMDLRAEELRRLEETRRMNEEKFKKL